MLDGEDVAIEVGDPLPPLHGPLEADDRVADVRRYLGPEELWVLVRKIGRRSIAQALIHADLGEFVEKRVQLSQVERIPELADQIRGAYQASFGVGDFIVAVVWHWKTRQLDRARDTFCFNETVSAEALSYGDLR